MIVVFLSYLCFSFHKCLQNSAVYIYMKYMFTYFIFIILEGEMKLIINVNKTSTVAPLTR